MKQRAIALLLCLALCASLLSISAFAVGADPAAETLCAGDVSVEPVSETIDGSVYEGQLSTGATYFAYIPDNAGYGNRPTSNPILIVYGDKAWTKETVKVTALASGLAEIADHEAGPVIFVNPKGESWTAADADSYLTVKDLFSDGSNNTYDTYNDPANEGRSPSTTAEDGTVTLGSYPGTRTRIYVFAEGKGADFVYENLAQGIYGAGQYAGNAIWKPVGMFLLNAASEKAVDLKGATAEGYNHVANDAAIESPAVLVNCSNAVKSALDAVNSPENTIAKTSSAKTLSDARLELLAAYNDLLEHHFTRDMGEGITLLPLRSAEQQGLIETKQTMTVSDGTEVIYYQYIPKNYTSCADGSMPLVLGFHGSGNTGEMFTWSSSWAEVAGANGIFYVAVDQHVRVTTASVIEIIDALKKAYPVIDASRIYSTGFSMGSMKTGALAAEYGSVFAGIAPFNLLSYSGSTNGVVMPTFYNGGEYAHFNMAFMMGGAMAECPTSNANCRTSVLQLMVDNGVMTRAAADAVVWPEIAWNPIIAHFTSGDPLYGLVADKTVTVPCTDYYGVEETIRYYNSADGNCYTALSSTTYAGHEPIWEVTKNAWNFLRQFSRDANGNIHINGDLALVDVASGAWYESAVTKMVQAGVMDVQNNRFAPNGSLTRGQLVESLYRDAGSPAAETSSFSDAATTAIGWAQSAGVVNGYPDGSFRPDAAVTREEMVTILWRYAKARNVDVSVGEDTNILSYDDALTIGEWAIPAMQWACGAGIVNGKPAGNALVLDPKGTATRAMGATILCNYLAK